MAVEQRVDIRHGQGFTEKAPWQMARTVVSKEGRGFEVSTVMIPPVTDKFRFETLVFAHPREVSKEVDTPELSPYNQSNIPDYNSAMDNHIQAVVTASEVLKSQS